MKEAYSRDQLVHDIRKVMNNMSPETSRRIEEEIRHDEKINFSKYISIYNGRENIENLSDAELYWLTLAISKSLKNFGKPEDYFEDAEIKNYRYFLPEEVNKVKRPLIFKPAIKLAENQYMFPCSVREIRSLKDANILQVSPELQRNVTKNKYNELKTKVNKKNAQEIADLIDNGKFYYNAIRFNLMDDGESDVPVYDEENLTLAVYDGTIIVPDGNHRTIGCELAKSNLDDKFCVLFTFLSAMDTRSLLNQEWTTVPIPKRHKEAMKQNSSNLIVDGIIRSADSDPIYSKEIVKDGFETKANHGFILYTDFADALDVYYDADNIETQQKRNDLRDWIVSYMNVLTEYMFDDFKNYKKLKQKKWSVVPPVIYFYVMISKIIREDKNWQEELKQILDLYDFSDENTRKMFSSHYKRLILSYCKEQEAFICSTLNKKSNS